MQRSAVAGNDKYWSPYFHAGAKPIEKAHNDDASATKRKPDRRGAV